MCVWGGGGGKESIQSCFNHEVQLSYSIPALCVFVCVCVCDA